MTINKYTSKQIMLIFLINDGGNYNKSPIMRAIFPIKLKAKNYFLRKESEYRNTRYYRFLYKEKKHILIPTV